LVLRWRWVFVEEDNDAVVVSLIENVGGDEGA
jgi:hypothetical protein